MSFYRFHGKLQDFGYFPVFEFIFLDQFEDQAASGGQLVDGLPDALDHFSGDQQLFRVKINAFELGSHFAQVFSTVLVLTGTVIERRILGSYIKVHLEVGYGFEPPAFLPYMDEYIRNRLFGLFFGRKEGACKMQQRIIEDHKQFPVGLLVIVTGNSPLQVIDFCSSNHYCNLSIIDFTGKIEFCCCYSCAGVKANTNAGNCSPVFFTEADIFTVV